MAAVLLWRATQALVNVSLNWADICCFRQMTTQGGRDRSMMALPLDYLRNEFAPTQYGMPSQTAAAGQSVRLGVGLYVIW
jgi:hypothetical protein